TPELQWPFQQWGASLVLSGHDHDYERLLINGFPYIVNGLGGRSTADFGVVVPGSVVRYTGEYGAMKVDASPTSITLQFINRLGTVIDTYSMNAPVPSPTATGTPPTSTRTSTATPTPVGTPLCNPSEPVSEGFESGTLGGFSSVVPTCLSGGCGWGPVVSPVPRTGNASAFARDVSNVADQQLVTTSPVAVSSGVVSATLSFWHKYGFEQGLNFYDGGVVEVSTNGGATWLTPTFTLNGYNGTIATCCSNPLSGRQAFVGSSTGGGSTYINSKVNLLPYAGHSIKIRFREGTDNVGGATGWNIDDVTVDLYGPCLTSTPTNAPTNTPSITPTNTNTASNTPTSEPTSTFTDTPTATYTFTPLPASTATNTPTTAGSPALLVGHLTWQGPPAQPDVGQQQPVTLTLRLDGVDTDYPAQTTDGSGNFTVTVTELSAGDYLWRAKGPKFLANSGVITLTGDPETDMDVGGMRAGDANGDDLVALIDFNIIKASFGKSQGQPGYDDRADFTADHVVFVSDFVLLKGNYGRSGDQFGPGGR
ncbi:MAG: hypothetical protein ACJ78Q_03615, partial [Chloroflexia bacterium]